MRALGEFRRRGGMLERRFTPAEQRMIGNLARGVEELMGTADELSGYEDPVLRRLLPNPYPDDPDEGADFAQATRARLASAKSAGAQRLVADLAAAPNGLIRLDAEAAIVWLKALGDLRLALAERVGVDEVQRTVHTPQGMLYAWLTWLQGSLVEAVDPA